MNDHVRGFVDDGDVGVFIKDIEGNILRIDAGENLFRDFEVDAFSSFEAMGRFFRDAADEDTAFVDESLDVSAADFRDLQCDKTIETLAGVFFGDDKFARAGDDWFRRIFGGNGPGGIDVSGRVFGRIFVEVERLVDVGIFWHVQLED
jgi:hypothetical protein